MTPLDAARRLAALWPPSATVAPETGLPVCIETTKHLVAAFKRSGVREVRPWVCELHVYNRLATAAVLGGLDEAEEGACRVEVSPEAAARQGDRRRGFHGHLVVDHPEFLLDLTLPGVLRSCGVATGRGFDGLGSFCGEKRNELIETNGAWMAITEDGVAVRYRHRPELASWRNSEAWRMPLDPGVVEALAEQLGVLLAE